MLAYVVLDGAAKLAMHFVLSFCNPILRRSRDAGTPLVSRNRVENILENTFRKQF
jgi:hypothetical protein